MTIRGASVSSAGNHQASNCAVSWLASPCREGNVTNSHSCPELYAAISSIK
eukprot:CAMPEP_0115721148 /NCGR_PEP_ID=MMETSP0272-20121206/78936_1 /TAXON_ID=71861 /ORGANISM="Scrippsiella trochoidea, Strain CCMP3099" /LENGTH=50 /DNA_ID=CAMNT_0003163977 /DNA_START=425 /DNA_END=577 /DNA_ORIENTATION=+